VSTSIVAALVLLGSALPLPARNHSLSGCLTDENGAPVHGAVIFIEEVEGSSKYTLGTDAKGCYKQDDIPDGHFEVRAEMNGRVLARKQVALEHAGSVTADLQFTPGSVSAAPAAPPIVNLKMLADEKEQSGGRRHRRFATRPEQESLIRSLTFQPEIANAGEPVMATVELAKRASEDGESIDVWTSNPSVASGPPEVVVPKGQMSASFPITTNRVRGRHDLHVTVKVSDDSGEQSAELQIRAYTRASVRMTGSGYGRVVSDPEGIVCTTGICTSSFADGEIVHFRAEPKAGSQFKGWSGDCDQTGKVVVTGPMSCVAEFQ
jgi:hypothetical protein